MFREVKNGQVSLNMHLGYYSEPLAHDQEKARNGQEQKFLLILEIKFPATFSSGASWKGMANLGEDQWSQFLWLSVDFFLDYTGKASHDSSGRRWKHKCHLTLEKNVFIVSSDCPLCEINEMKDNEIIKQNQIWLCYEIRYEQKKSGLIWMGNVFIQNPPQNCLKKQWQTTTIEPLNFHQSPNFHTIKSAV